MKPKLLNLITRKGLLLLISLAFTASIQSAQAGEKVKSIDEIRISIQLENEPVKTAFRTIDKKTGLKFMYNSRKVALNKKVSISGKDKSVKEILTQIAKETGLGFKQINRNILVKAYILGPTKKELKAMKMEAFGVLKGKISDENGLGLPGATILVTDVNSTGAVSDENGQFIILNVPAGSHQLKITYIGYSTLEREVEVAGGVTNEIKLSLEPGVTIGQEVLILGDRLKGQAKAINQQRTNSNITNIVAADQIGRFPDANIGDAMKRIPGITIQNDQGEARDIIIRGLAPQLNSVMINGERIPSAEGDNRRIQLDLIPADMVQTIEVNKALTPDMDADAIGGAVNLVTRSTPDGLRVSGTLGTGMNFLSNKPIWTGALVIGDRIANDKLGVIVSTSYNHHNFGSDNIEAVWIDTDDGPILDEFDLRTYQVERIRRSVSLGLDYEFNPNNKIYLNGMYNWRDDRENRYRYRVGEIEDAYENAHLDPSDEDYDPEGWIELSPGLFQTKGRIERQTKGGIDSDRGQQKRLEDQRVYNMTLKGDHLIASKLKMDWSVTYAKASEDRLNEKYISYRTSDLPVLMDIRNPNKPQMTSLNENQYQTLELNTISDETQMTYERDINGRLDFRLPIGKNGVFKFGGRYRGKEKKRDNIYSEFEPLDIESFGEFMGDIPIEDQSKSDFLAGEKYQAGNFVTKQFLSQLDLKNTNIFEESDEQGEYIPGNYKANENIIAAYAMADYQFSEKFYALAGVRMENTQIDYQGFSFNFDTEDVGTTEGTDSYTNILPYLHLKYNLNENQILRFAVTQTLARPDYFKLVPFEAFNPDGPELEAGNPNLNPSVSSNLDFMAENYFKSIGIVSAGGFYKNIQDFIYTRVEENYSHPVYGDDIEFVTYQNGNAVDVYGFELAFQRQLDFLPGFMKGLGIYLNYTNTNSNASGIQGREDEDLVLPGTAKHMFNGSLSYETKKLVLRLSLNHASDYLDELGGETFEDSFYDKQTFLDFNGSYAFTPKWRLFVDINNITNQPLRYYQGVSNRTMQAEYYNLRMNVGVKFDLFNK
ncbi:MAG: TonB-dependent receptor [Flammeovirgaceae bacterium]|nr:TonB-dependent receptor [Flammeovirgaceae bacterium]